jgi:hypothetical protein
MSKIFQASLPAWSDRGTDLDTQDYKRLKERDMMKPLKGPLIL